MSLKSKKIVSKDKSFVSMNEHGQMWISTDNGRSFIHCGSMHHGFCNIHRIHCQKSLLDTEYVNYFPVHFKVLRFADRLGIKKLRLIDPDSKLLDHGWIQESKYGYVRKEKFDHLMKHRKQIDVRDSKVLLLKDSDIDWKKE